MTADCPNCRRFREERDEAIEALRQAREASAPTKLALGFQKAGFPPQRAQVLAALVERGSLTTHSAAHVAAMHVGEYPTPAHIKVIMCHLRQAGVDIPRLKSGSGNPYQKYELAAPERERWRRVALMGCEA